MSDAAERASEVLGALDYMGMSSARENRHREQMRALIGDILEVASALAELDERRATPTEAGSAVAAVNRLMREALARAGVEPIPGAGAMFDSALHQAALVRESDADEGTILEEVRKGYRYKGEVLRPAIVVVAGKERKS